MTRFVVCSILALAAIASAPGTSSAQGGSSAPAKAPAVGAILGIVSDSLHDALLADAVVTVVQLPRHSALSSGKGAFRIDSLPPGRYTLELSHPVLDTLGVRVVSDTVVVVAGETRTVDLSVPSPAVVIAQLCTPLQRKLGPAALMGHVIDADTEAPVEGAEVSVAWVETTVDPVRGVLTGPRVRRATVGPDGAFRLCGLPSSVRATIQAVRGAAKTAELTVVTANEPLAIRRLRLASTPPQIVTQDSAVAVKDAPDGTVVMTRRVVTGPATVSGTVTNRGGVALAGARVSVPGSTAAGVAGADGRFVLKGVPTGTQVINVRQVGYDPVQLALDVTSAGPNRIDARLGQAPIPHLEPVTVTGKKSQSEIAATGFDKRRKLGIGKYLTEADIERYQPTLVSDALRYMPGVYVVGSGAGMTMYSRRGNGCVRYVIDKHGSDATRGVTLDEMLRPDDILGVEYYEASEVPEEFNLSRNAGCAVLVIWTRASVKDTSKKK